MRQKQDALVVLLGRGGVVRAVVLALDLFHELLHLLSLLAPLVLAHLLLLVEEVLVGLAVGATKTVPERRVLAVVVVEVEVVHGVAGGAVDDGAVGHVLAVVDHNGPEVDKNKKPDGRELVQREQHREDVVRQRLRPPVHRVEGVRRERRRHDPLVVRLVQVLVHARVVQAPVDQVDHGVGEEDEEGVLQPLVPLAGALRGRVVELGIAVDFEQPERRRQEGHARHRLVGLLDLEPHLVLEVLRVLHGLLVEDEIVRERGKHEV